MGNAKERGLVPKKNNQMKKSWALKRALEDYGARAYDDSDNTPAEELAKHAWEMAINGSLEWAAFVADRIMGKPAAAVSVGLEGGAEGGGQITVNLVNFAASLVDSPSSSVIDVTPEEEREELEGLI